MYNKTRKYMYNVFLCFSDTHNNDDYIIMIGDGHIYQAFVPVTTDGC